MQGILGFLLGLDVKFEGLFVGHIELAECTLQIVCLGHPRGRWLVSVSVLRVLLFLHLLLKNLQEC